MNRMAIWVESLLIDSMMTYQHILLLPLHINLCIDIFIILLTHFLRFVALSDQIMDHHLASGLPVHYQFVDCLAFLRDLLPTEAVVWERLHVIPIVFTLRLLVRFVVEGAQDANLQTLATYIAMPLIRVIQALSRV